MAQTFRLSTAPAQATRSAPSKTSVMGRFEQDFKNDVAAWKDLTVRQKLAVAETVVGVLMVILQIVFMLMSRSRKAQPHHRNAMANTSIIIGAFPIVAATIRYVLGADKGIWSPATATTPDKTANLERVLSISSGTSALLSVLCMCIAGWQSAGLQSAGWQSSGW